MTTFQDTPSDPVDELGLLLARYADTALKPDPFAMDRLRAQLRARAQRAAVAGRAEALAVASIATVAPARSRGIFGAWSMRRLSLTVAASLVLGLTIGASTFAASRAGGALYEPRVWIETATLPREAGPRLQAELALADLRLTEANEAAARGDTAAVTAALDAFNGLVDMTTAEHLAGTPGNATALAAIAKNVDRLLALAGQVPEVARTAVMHAVDASRTSIDTLQKPPLKPSDPGQPGGHGGQGGGGPAATDKPEKTPKPTKASTPEPTPNATPAKGNDGGNGGAGGNGGGSGGGNGTPAGPPKSQGPPASHVPPGGGAGGDPPGKQRTPKP